MGGGAEGGGRQTGLSVFGPLPTACSSVPFIFAIPHVQVCCCLSHGAYPVLVAQLLFNIHLAVVPGKCISTLQRGALSRCA